MSFTRTPLTGLQTLFFISQVPFVTADAVVKALAKKRAKRVTVANARAVDGGAEGGGGGGADVGVEGGAGGGAKGLSQGARVEGGGKSGESALGCPKSRPISPGSDEPDLDESDEEPTPTLKDHIVAALTVSRVRHSLFFLPFFFLSFFLLCAMLCAVIERSLTC